jgi:hypothetical protein
LDVNINKKKIKKFVKKIHHFDLCVILNFKKIKKWHNSCIFSQKYTKVVKKYTANINIDLHVISNLEVARSLGHKAAKIRKKKDLQQQQCSNFWNKILENIYLTFFNCIF